MNLIDTHCHLYLPEFREDLDEVIKRAENEGVKKMFLPCIDSSVIDDMISLEKKYPKNCFAMMGLHPGSVKENVEDELTLVQKQVNERTFSALGEIGLDFYWDTTFKKEQYEAFEFQMQLALEKNLPIVIHSRNAMQETINTVKPFAVKGLKGIFHCFGDTYENALQIIDMGFYLGIGGVLTYKKSGLSDVLKELNLDNLVLETDAPYLTPVPFRGKRNESSYLKYIAQTLAEIKSVSIEEVAEITTTNAERIFKIE